MSLAARLAAPLVLVVVLVAGSPAPATEAATVTIGVGDNWFCSPSFNNGVCPTTISLGDTVRWNFNGAAISHTSTDCGSDCDSAPNGEVWNSGVISGGGGTFDYTFTETGTFRYFCTLHPISMRGEITVLAGVGGIAELPSLDVSPAGDDATSDRSRFAFAIAGAAVGAVVLGTIALVAVRRQSKARP